MRIEKKYYLRFSDGMYFKADYTKTVYATHSIVDALSFESEDQLLELVNSFFRTALGKIQTSCNFKWSYKKSDFYEKNVV